MFTRPDDLSDDDIVAALVDGWGLAANEVEYAAVGFGSHHWRVTSDGERWFVNVDDLDARKRDASETRAEAARRLAAALDIARSLRDGGLEFVVAPVPTRANHIIHPIRDRYVVSLFEHVDGDAHSWSPYPSGVDRLAVLDRIVAVHTIRLGGVFPGDDFAIPSRDQLTAALANPATGWGPGPYATPTQELVRQHGAAIQRALVRYDQLVDHVANGGRRRVLTHGEPHRGNTIDTADGVALIDWDTALLAPPERDLWMLIDEDPHIAADYTERTGIEVDDHALQLYQLWWDLCEISLFVAEFRQPHDDTEDTRIAWAGLARFLDPTRWSHLI